MFTVRSWIILHLVNELLDARSIPPTSNYTDKLFQQIKYYTFISPNLSIHVDSARAIVYVRGTHIMRMYYTMYIISLLLICHHEACSATKMYIPVILHTDPVQTITECIISIRCDSLFSTIIQWISGIFIWVHFGRLATVPSRTFAYFLIHCRFLSTVQASM